MSWFFGFLDFHCDGSGYFRLIRRGYLFTLLGISDHFYFFPNYILLLSSHATKIATTSFVEQPLSG